LHYKKLYGRLAILWLLLLFCSGCTQAGGASPSMPMTPPNSITTPPNSITYYEIVLDTYDPVSPGAFATHNTYMELWSSDGKTLIASNDSGTNSGRQPKLGSGFAYIDWTGGLTSGDYYVLVTETLSAQGADAFGYAIRVMTVPSSTANTTSDWSFAGAATESKSDQPVPSVPLAGPGGVPTLFQTMVLDTGNAPAPTAANHLNRFLVVNGVNWIKITLP
jgi:hypothetical protein